jgi:membrane fusion protein (multidrug efflux system)
MKLQSHPALFALPILMLLISCGGHKEEKAVVTPVNVKVYSASSKGGTAQQISYSGTVKESKSISLAFQVSGNIISINADKGQAVKKGQLLASVDETVYRDQYNAQLAQQKLAQDNYNRVAEVFKKGSIAEIKVVEAKSQRDQAVSVARATYQNIAHTKLYAPTDGYIGEKMAEAGDLAAPGSPVFKLVKLELLDIIVPVPESEINGIKKGQEAKVKIAALENRAFKGKIDEVAVISEAASHNYSVKVRVSNADGQLKPGMVANVYFGQRSAAGKAGTAAISIPLIALQVDEQNRNFVYIVDQDGRKALRRQVKPGELMNDAVTVTEGLSAADRVIVSGYQKVTSGTPVKIIQ